VKPRAEALGKELPGWLTGALVLGALAVTLWLEKRRPLRRAREDKLRRDARNLAMGAMTAVTIRLTEKPIVAPLAKKVHEKGWGLLPRLKLPPALEVALAAVLLDYTLYVWHVLTHRVPFLWRFHRAHHADFDLSATTALRFHFVEMMLSVPWRAAQVAAIGAAPRSLSLWQTLTLLAILFHHSNVRLPMALERWLCRVFVTPRMHGIHHSIVDYETNSNWGTIFSVPDYLHRTIRLNVPQQRIGIGIPAFRGAEELRLGGVLRMPFGAQQPTWRLGGAGPMPERREPLAEDAARLAE
jgi:sterol desaturase/sphingolipid hydroxylase (fatty acid hydroxylase superfamily)